MQVLRRNRCQTRTRPRKKACFYGAGVSGATIFAYVEGDPLRFSDPHGLDPWYKETMHVYTDRSGERTMVFTPSGGKVFEFDSRNNVTSNALPGADGPYEGKWTFCQYPNTGEFGTAKWRTDDDRLRWVHGGGTGLPEPLASRQGWKPTKGCTRAQNEDVEKLCSMSEEWQRKNPRKRILYHRQ
jgi:hypothetical protein